MTHDPNGARQSDFSAQLEGLFEVLLELLSHAGEFLAELFVMIAKVFIELFGTVLSSVLDGLT